MPDRAFGIETLCLHAGQIPDAETGSRATPIHQTAAYVFDSAEHAAALFDLQTFGHVYSRLGNPTVSVLEQRIAALEGGRACLATASGMAAEMVAMLTLCRQGDHIVAANTLYGGTVSQFGVTFARFGIDADALNRPVRLFSKGMAQKLALAAALSADKPLLVLDEPMSGLDPLARDAVASMLQQAHRRGATLLFSSHSLVDVARLCDRLVIVHDGTLRFVGTPAALIEEQQASDLDQAFLSRIH